MSLSLSVSIAASLGFTAAVLWAAVADLITMKIRNELVLVLLVGYVVLAPLSSLSWPEIGWSIAIAVGILTGMFVFFGFGWIGGGDAKLAAVITLWLGVDHALLYVLYTALFGGILTLLLLQFRLKILPAQCLTVPWLMRLHAPETGVPYGVAIAAAALFTFPETSWMKALA